MSLNHDLSNLFQKMAAVMDLKGESAFKSIAFSRVSRVLNDLPVDVRTLHEQGKLAELQGVGESSRRVIEEYVRTGRSTDFDELTASVPAGLLPMLNIPGLGPKTVALLWKERGVTSTAELTEAIAAGKLDGLKGVGAKKIESIKQGIALLERSAGRIGIAEALPIAQALVERVRALPQVERAEVAGSLRRRAETIGDVDLVCCANGDGTAVLEAFSRFPEVDRVLVHGATKVSVLTAAGLQVDLRLVPVENYGAALLYFTGSKDHGKRIRGLALDRGMTLNEWGIYKLADHATADKETGHAPKLKPLASRTEADVYAQLKMAYVEPELREDRGEVEAALRNELPQLIELSDIKGDLHTHTTASDGTNTIDEMAEAAIGRGYAFLGITDHSKAQTIANGLTAERLLKHAKAIRQAAERYKGDIRLLAGCEVDILADGTLDFPDEVLAELDFVVASPHLALKQDEQKATDRIKRAIENRYVTIIGHPTGRLIGQRDGLPLRFDQLFPLAAANGTAMEINAGYPRLDLNEAHARAAVAAGVRLSINTDAHSTAGLGGLQYGLNVARRAWVTKVNVINCLTVAKLEAFIAAKRR
jgi:DNA polymerase (family 10)